jgi:1-acyl-sn-glycerol-3-phosphate acyltransferase
VISSGSLWERDDAERVDQTGRMRRLLARLFLKLTGWTLTGEPPDHSAVVIAAFHTSNHDFSKLVAIMWMWRSFEPRWMAKHTLFRPPMGWVLRRMGGIPVHRDRRDSVVEQTAKLLRESDDLALVITPEGTRSAAPYWKSGFYHIALAADVPVVLGFLDYRTRRFGLGPEIRLTGDMARDMDAIRAFYRDKVGKRLENQGPVRLREEEEETAHG